MLDVKIDLNLHRVNMLFVGLVMHCMLHIHMYLQMQRDVWLDNVINLRRNILRYTVPNPTSLRNIAFHWLTSEYMPLASVFMQLADAGRIGATQYIFTVFSK